MKNIFTLKRFSLYLVLCIFAFITRSKVTTSLQFWIWLAVICFVAILMATLILNEEPFELFNYISLENFKQSPTFGILVFPLVISIFKIAYLLCVSVVLTP